MTEITLSARDVRRLAEALDGVRGETFQVVLRDGKLHRLAGVETPLASDRKLFSVFGPNVLVMATSVASRPRAMRTRQMRGTLFRGSNVCHCPSR